MGDTFDIHGGGLDLIFPHHENEIAQSVCAHDGHPFARYWLHNGMLTVNGAKMAKSEGNFITVRDALKEWDGEVIRLALLGTHYRDPLDWTEERLQQAQQTLDRFYRALALPSSEPGYIMTNAVTNALVDDLNSPRAVHFMHEFAADIHKAGDDLHRSAFQHGLKEAGRLLGLLERSPSEWLQRGPKLSDIIEKQIS